MTYVCPRCRLGVDKPGRCPECRHAPRAKRPGKFYSCRVCRAPFREGNPHRRCLPRALRAASQGKRPERKKWKASTGQFFW